MTGARRSRSRYSDHPHPDPATAPRWSKADHDAGGRGGTGTEAEPRRDPDQSARARASLEAPNEEILELTFEGVVEPVRRVEVSNQVTGTVDAVMVSGGENVSAGDVLFVIDPAPYRIGVDAARASVEEARARLRLAQDAAAREADLLERGTGARVRALETEVAVEIAQADLAARESDLAQAELELARTRIRAPIDGQVGRPLVSPGAFVEAEAGSVLAEIVQLDPAVVAYRVPYADRMRAFEHAGLASVQELFARITLALELPTERPYPHAGHPRFESARVEPETGMLTTWAEFCAYCIDMHSRDLLKRGVAVEKLVLVPVWREAGDLFSEQERAAMAWAETVTRAADTAVPDADYREAAAAFSDKEFADLTIAVALMNAYNRLAVSFRTPPAAAQR